MAKSGRKLNQNSKTLIPISDLVEGRWKLDSEGMLHLPDGAGLGISLDMDAVEKHTARRFGPASMSA